MGYCESYQSVHLILDQSDFWLKHWGKVVLGCLVLTCGVWLCITSSIEMSQKCTPVWRETHFQVKMYKTHHVRNCSDHFWKLHVEKVHAFVARSTFPSQKCKKLAGSDHCTPAWHEARFQVKSEKKLMRSDHFWKFRCRFAWQAPGIVHLVKSELSVKVL